MRDLYLIGCGILMGAALNEMAHIGWRNFQGWRRRRAEGPQWFRRQTPSDARPGPAPAQHPTPSRIKGQRAAHATASPKLRQGRFGGRVRRNKAAR